MLYIINFVWMFMVLVSYFVGHIEGYNKKEKEYEEEDNL